MDEKNNELVIDPTWRGHSGLVTLTVRNNGEVLHNDTINLNKAKSLEQFICDLTTGRQGIDPEEVRKLLLQLAGERSSSLEKDDQKKNLADLLVQLAAEAEFFHDANQRAYATIKVGNHFENWPVRSRPFKLWLRRRLREVHNRSAYPQALQAAIEEIESQALFGSPQVEVHVRLAEYEGSIWLDLGDEHWRCVEITAKGWKVAEEKAPVRFIRPKGLQPLSVPIPGGTVELLRPFLNVRDQDGFVLLVAWLLGAYHPHGPYPVLNIHGEQGSAKTTVGRLLRSLVDPNSAPLRSEPRNSHDLIIAASNSWIVAYDNISRIPVWLSDAICRLSTGGGFSTRELYSDREEVIFEAQRPVSLNGISEVAHRPDLLDRSLIITLLPIPEDRRMGERKLRQEFEAIRPKILGALLDAVSAGLANLAKVKLDRLPRMADFALWASACEIGLGWPAGTFMAAYEQNRASANDAAIEASVVGPVVQYFMEGRKNWEGTATELLTELANATDEQTKNRRGWPGSARKLSGDLQRIAPNLRALGIDVRRPADSSKSHKRLIRLERLSDGSDGSDGVLQDFCKSTNEDEELVI